jgi:hypothetical protein
MPAEAPVTTATPLSGALESEASMIDSLISEALTVSAGDRSSQ